MRRIIDGHVHLAGKHEPDWVDPLTGYRHGAYGMLHTPLGSRRRMPPFMADSAFSAETLLEVMDEYGVEKSVLMARLESGTGELAVHAVKLCPERIAAAVSVEIRMDSVQALSGWYQKGIRVLKFEMRGLNEFYGSVNVDCEEILSLCREAERLGMVVVFDPGPIHFPCSQPQGLKRILDMCRDLKVVICHMGLPQPGLRQQPELYRKWKSVVELADCGHVWFDVTAIPDLFDQEGFPYQEGMSYFQELKEQAGIDRLIWGTDIPGTFQRATYRQMIRMFEQQEGLTEDEKDRLFYRNADQLYFAGPQ